MKIKSIEFNDESMPKNVTVEMTIKEAAWIAMVAGKTYGDGEHSNIYDALCCRVFNAYWEDGITDAVDADCLNVMTPDIVFPEHLYNNG